MMYKKALRAVYAQQAFEQNEYAINITDLEGNIIAANQAYLDLYHFEKEEDVVGKPQSIIKSKNTSPKTYKDMWDSISNGRPWKGELINMDVTGGEIPVFLSIRPLRDDGEVIAYLGFTVDRSQQVELEKQLLHSNRLAVLGTLGAGLAHELNNPLTSISLEAENLRDVLLEDEFDLVSAKDSVKTIINGTDRMHKVIQHLLSYVRKSSLAEEKINLFELIDESLLFLHRQLMSHNIKVNIVCEKDLWLRGARTDLESVVHNLITNSKDAFVADGVKREIKIECTKSEDQWIEIHYSDNAGGISEQHIQQIFDPFFTTKIKGKGTGLGLSISRKIIQEHHGIMRCYSNKPETHFVITLPGTDAPSIDELL